MGPVSAYPSRLPCAQCVHSNELHTSRLPHSPFLPQQNPPFGWQGSLQCRCRSKATETYSDAQGRMPVLCAVICFPLCLMSRGIKNTVLLPVNSRAWTSWTPSGRQHALLLPTCFPPSYNEGLHLLAHILLSTIPALGILLFVSPAMDWVPDCSFYLPKESLQALTPGCLQSLSKTICV